MNVDGISFEEADGRLRISWDNREVRKDRFTFWFLSLFLVVWIPMTCIATRNIFVSGEPLFFLIWCLFGWLGSIVVPLTLLQRSWSEWIEVDASKISWGYSGLFARKPKELPLSEVKEIGLGYHSEGDRYRRDADSIVTLSLYEAHPEWGLRKRHILAYWLRRDLKKLVYDHIMAFAEKRNIPITATNYDSKGRRVLA